jgi:hypothetical protein
MVRRLLVSGLQISASSRKFIFWTRQGKPSHEDLLARIQPSQRQQGVNIMATTEQESTINSKDKKDIPPESDPTKIDRNAPAGSKNSLGAESIRDGRPSTDDSIVEAIDEEDPATPTH